jgi:hypothetical protein
MEDKNEQQLHDKFAPVCVGKKIHGGYSLASIGLKEYKKLKY